jgi:UDP-glucose 4-epimerase
VVAVYANNDRAVQTLGWKIRYGLEEMVGTAWKWELKIKEDEDLLHRQKPDLN